MSRVLYVLRHPITMLDRWWQQSAPTRRLDHSPANLCMVLGLMAPALSIVLVGPSPSSALADMGENIQILMCACIFTGGAIKLHGAASHTRFWFRDRALRRCYQIGYAGAPIASAGLFVYGYYLIENTVTWSSTLGATGTMFFAVGLLLQGFVYWLESRRLETAERQLIAIAKSVKGLE